MALDKNVVRAAVRDAEGSDAFLRFNLRAAQPVLRYLWDNHVPWIVRKLVDFVGAIDDYLDEEYSKPVGRR